MFGPRTRYWIGLAALSAVYIAFGRLGLAMPYVGTNVTLVWAPSGIALAVLSRWGLRFWPGVWAGAVLVALSVNMPVGMSCLIASGNTLAAIIGRWLLCDVGHFQRMFPRHRDLVLFTLFGVMLSPMVSATVGAGAMVLNGRLDGAGFQTAWASWWSGDAAGVLFAAPLILLWDPQVLRRLRQDHRLTEFFGSLLLLCLIGVLLAERTLLGTLSFAGIFLPVFVLWWAVLRFPAWEGACCVFFFTAVIVVSTALGMGPFISDDPRNGQEALWFFIWTTSLVVLIRASTQSERDRIASEYERFFDASMDLLCIAGLDGYLRRVNAATEKVLGYSRDELYNQLYLELAHPEDQPAFVERLQQLAAGRDITNFECRFRRKDGAYRIIVWNLAAPQPEEQQLHGVGRDVTDERKSEETVQEILAAVSPTTGDDFFQTLVDHLSCVCNTKYAMIARICPTEPTRVETLAVSGHGTPRNNITYDLQGTPCEQVVGQDFCHYPGGVRQTFTEDKLLVEMDVDAYMGIPLRGNDGQVLGLVVLLNDRPFEDPQWTESLLRIVAVRAGAEVDRMLTVKALKVSEQRFRSIFEQAGIAVGLLESQSGRFVHINDKYVELLGYADEELAGRTWMSVTHPDDVPQSSDQMERLLAREIAEFTVEKRLFRRDRSIIWVNLTVSPLWEPEESPGHHIAIVEDITLRKRAEQELRKVRERLELAVHGTSDGLWDWDLAADRFWISARGMELLGHEARDQIRPTEEWWAMLHPDEFDRTHQAIHQHITRDEPYDVELRLRTANGRYHWFRLRARLAHDVSGEPVRMAGSLQDITDQRQTREKLERSHQMTDRVRNRLLDAIESIPDGFALYDADDRLVLCNEQYRKIYDISADLLVPGVRFEDHIRTSAYRGQVEEAIGREEDWVREQLARHQNPVSTHLQQLGNGRWLQISEQKTREGGIVSVRTDITDLKQAEDAVRQSESRWRSLTEHSADHVLTLDRELRIQFCNYASPGLTVDDLIGTPLTMYVDEQQRAKITAILHGVIDTRESADYETEYTDLQGQSIYYESRVSPTVIEDEVIGLTVAARDVTERKRAENALRLSEQKLRFTQFSVDNSLTEIYHVDSEGRFHYVNDAVCCSLGYSRSELLQLRMTEICQDISDEDWCEWWRRIKTAGAIHMQQVHLRKDGSTCPVEVTITYLEHEDAQLLVAFGQDITEREQAKLQLERQNSELAHVARLSTMGEMVSMLSHELSQPLAIISNYTGACRVLLDGKEPVTLRVSGMVDEIALQVERAGEILTQVRDFVRDTEPHKSTWDMNQLIQDSLKLVASDLRFHGVNVRTQLTDEPLSASVDRVQIQQVIVNLLTNARDAMLDVDTSERTATITSRREGNRAVLEVGDTGSGLAPEIRDHLFEPFRTTKESGMGLGLSICHSIVSLHGGTVTTVPGRKQGTLFQVSLPLINETDRSPDLVLGPAQQDRVHSE